MTLRHAVRRYTFNPELMIVSAANPGGKRGGSVMKKGRKHKGRKGRARKYRYVVGCKRVRRKVYKHRRKGKRGKHRKGQKGRGR
jgi:hypothetical protein